MRIFHESGSKTEGGRGLHILSGDRAGKLLIQLYSFPFERDYKKISPSILQAITEHNPSQNIPFVASDWKKLHLLSEILASLGITGANLKALLNPSI